MKRIIQLGRLMHIGFVLVRCGIDDVLLSEEYVGRWHVLTYLNPVFWFRRRPKRGVAFRRALEELGPIFVKFGQMLSTRRDLLPRDIVDELARLQDQVPPFSSDKVKKILEKAYGSEIHEVFDCFEDRALASASVAQVHQAYLKDGTHIAIKILRPKIERIIRRDISLLYVIAKLIKRFWSEGYRLRPVEVVSEFETTICDELDLIREAANASQLRRNFLESDLLYIPKIYWPYVRKNVLVLEFLDGIPISDVERLRAEGYDLKKLAERGVEVFYRQLFEYSFFHADMHPGNIFVAKGTQANPQYMAVDFGIMGVLGPTDQRYLVENMLAFFQRDYRRVAILHVQSGWVPPDTRVDQFEAAIRTVCEPVFEKPLKDISFGRLLMRLFQIAGRFNMTVQPQLLLLQKTLINVEGLGRELDPDLDLWKTGQPFFERWMREKMGPKALIKKVYRQSPHWLERLTQLPDLLYNTLSHAERNQVVSERDSVAKVTKSNRPFFLVIGGLLILLVGFHNFLGPYSQWVQSSQLWLLLAGVLTMLYGARR